MRRQTQHPTRLGLGVWGLGFRVYTTGSITGVVPYGCFQRFKVCYVGERGLQRGLVEGCDLSLFGR